MKKIILLGLIMLLVTGCTPQNDPEPPLQNNPDNKGMCLEYATWTEYKFDFWGERSIGTQHQKCVRWEDLDVKTE